MAEHDKPGPESDKPEFSGQETAAELADIAAQPDESIEVDPDGPAVTLTSLEEARAKLGLAEPSEPSRASLADRLEAARRERDEQSSVNPSDGKASSEEPDGEESDTEPVAPIKVSAGAAARLRAAASRVELDAGEPAKPEARVTDEELGAMPAPDPESRHDKPDPEEPAASKTSEGTSRRDAAREKLETSAAGTHGTEAYSMSSRDGEVRKLSPEEESKRQTRLKAAQEVVDREDAARHEKVEAAERVRAEQAAADQLKADVDAIYRARQPEITAQYLRDHPNAIRDVGEAQMQAFQLDRAAAEMNALEAQYRMQREVIGREGNIAHAQDHMVDGDLHEGELTVLEREYKAAIQAVRERYAKYKVETTATNHKLGAARAKHQDFDESITSDSTGEGASKAWVLRHELGIDDGTLSLARYGGTRSYGGMFRGARMIQRVYEVPNGGYLVECVKASTGEFVRSTVINSAREPMRFGRFRVPFTGTEIEAKLKTLRKADLKRERPKNVGEYFGIRFGPELPQRTGQFAYDISGTAAWDSQLGGPRYNAPRRKPWYLSMWILRSNQNVPER